MSAFTRTAITFSTAQTTTPFPLANNGAMIGRSFDQTRTLLTRDMAGRFVTRGFSYTSRIGRGSAMRLWQPPPDMQKKMSERLDWVLIRQVEMLQEKGDQAIESLDIEDRLWAMRESVMMRAEGVRLVIVVAGYSNPPKNINDQKKFDRMLEMRLRNLDRMVWFDEMSAEATKQIRSPNFSLEERLPHVFSAVQAAQVYGHTEKMDCANIDAFFKQIADLPAKEQLHHTVMIGLKSPRSDLFNRRKFNRLSERMQTPFFSALRDMYAHFGLTVHRQMRGYGNHVSSSIADYKKPLTPSPSFDPS